MSSISDNRVFCAFEIFLYIRNIPHGKELAIMTEIFSFTIHKEDRRLSRLLHGSRYWRYCWRLIVQTAPDET